MKTRILILVMAISFIGNAQGDLQFNQVLTYTVNSTQANVYTVPAGKVAKIVKAIEKSSSSHTMQNLQLMVTDLTKFKLPLK